MVQAIRSPIHQLRFHQNYNTTCTTSAMESNKYYYKPIPIKSSLSHNLQAKYSFGKNGSNIIYHPPMHLYEQQEQQYPRLKSKSSSFVKYYKGRSSPALLPPSYISNMQCQRVSIMDVCEVTPTPKVVKKCVRFNEVKEIRTLPKPTIEDKLHRWYNRDDYKRFDADRRLAVQIVQQAILLNRQHQQEQQQLSLSSSSSKSCTSLCTYLDPNLYTFIGIENQIYGKQRMMYRKLNTLRHIQSVLQEQQNNRIRQNYHEHRRYQQQIHNQENYCMNNNINNNSMYQYHYQLPQHYPQSMLYV